MKKYVTTDPVSKKFMAVFVNDEDVTHTWTFDSQDEAQEFVNKIK